MGSDLRFHPGNIMRLELPGRPFLPQMSARIAGVLADQALIITHPTRAGRQVPLTVGEAVVGRVLDGLRFVSFDSRVLHVDTRPCPHVYLAYPQRMGSEFVRRSPRVPVELPCLVTLPDHSRPRGGTMVDLSVDGCRVFLTTHDAPLRGTRVHIAAEFDLAGGIERPLQVDGEVRGASEVTELGRSIGVEFVDCPEQTALLLRAYLYERLLAEAEEIAGQPEPSGPLPATPPRHDR